MKVLLAVNSEYGQANVFLALGHALQAHDAAVQIHFASFGPIAGDVSNASDYSVRSSPGAQPWVFHQLDGPAFLEAAENIDSDIKLGEAIVKPPTFFNVLEMLKLTPRLLLPWSGSEFLKICQSLSRVVDEVQPDIIAVDSLFSPGLTVCRHRRLKYLVFSPNTLKDFSAVSQPWGGVFWKLPAMGSGFPFPVPLRCIPANIIYVLCAIYHSLRNGAVRAVAAQVKRELGGAELVTFEDIILRPPADLRILVANRPEVDFPVVVPKHLTACGPVIRPVPSVADVDPELDAWLKRGPTVFISLGTHRMMPEPEALEMAEAVRQLLEAAEAKQEADGADKAVGGIAGKLQVIWKLMKPTGATWGTGSGSKVHGVLAQALDADQVRIVDWVKPQPSAVLLSGTVVCSVNHGGANSFHDALTSGIPQVVLPPWMDCYDFASRAEVLGIGRWGNQKTMPACTARELGPILIDVVLGPKAPAMRARVQELAALCAKSPGAAVAAAAVLEEAGAGKA
ncbi:03f8b00b-9304-4255-8b5f-6a0b5eeade64 [Thermothielavioides terrestris]|uniref:03f8b00b-9304-4255-8b5f-6a0b5eeade64 n=1 Tax=Thermothielavioides terrestris TaxID=2587410 RepID=A0A3S4AU87_9PEZI|nr:03f8b00b-9304-4255-8b5f-6a0b5eeade64 [Thermothielavioides terrestris]